MTSHSSAYKTSSYIYIYIHLFILLISIVPKRNEKNCLSGILIFLLVAITFSLANCELNYTPFWCVWGIYPNLLKLFKQGPWLIDLIDQHKLKFWTLNFASNETFGKSKAHYYASL